MMEAAVTKILLLQGANLTFLGRREPEIYGSTTPPELDAMLQRHWGTALSHSFPHQPETNGVAERFFRTLKEQAIYGQIFHTAAEVRTAVATFVTRYNASWRLARLGYMSPLDFRARHRAAASSQMAA
jgi:hypothetical protein